MTKNWSLLEKTSLESKSSDSTLSYLCSSVRFEERIVLSESLYVRFTPIVVKNSSKLAYSPYCRNPAALRSKTFLKYSGFRRYFTYCQTMKTKTSKQSDLIQMAERYRKIRLSQPSISLEEMRAQLVRNRSTEGNVSQCASSPPSFNGGRSGGFRVCSRP